MSSKNILFAFGIGLSLGAAVALLYAPQSGEATRKKLGQGVEDAGDYLEDTAEYLKEQAERLSTEAQKLLDRARGTVEQAANQAGGIVGGVLKIAQRMV